jgi:hypothetical protein
MNDVMPLCSYHGGILDQDVKAGDFFLARVIPVQATMAVAFLHIWACLVHISVSYGMAVPSIEGGGKNGPTHLACQ